MSEPSALIWSGVWTCWFDSSLLGRSSWSVSSFSSYVFLTTINIEHLGSITFSEVLKLKTIRNEFTCSWSFLVWLLVCGPWIVSFRLDGGWLTWERSCMVGMSSLLSSSRFLNNILKESRVSWCMGMLYDWEISRKVTSIAASAKDLSYFEKLTLVFFEVLFWEIASCFF